MPVLAIGAFIASAVTTVTEVVGLTGALVGSGIGGAFGGTAGAIIGTAFGETVAVSALEIGALMTASDLLLGKQVGQDGGTQVDFMANPQAGVPYAMGRTGTAGTIVLADSAGTNSKYLTYVSVQSLGPIQSYESFQANTISVIFNADNNEGAGQQNTVTSTLQPLAAGATVIQVGNAAAFSNGQVVTIAGHNYTISNVYPGPKELQLSSGLVAAIPIYTEVLGPTVTSGFLNRMWLKTQVGAANSPALTFTSTDSKDTPANHSGIPSVWTSACQLSGLAAAMWTLEYDAQIYSGGTPLPTHVVHGVYVYDPRQDSTYPGGSGACRSNDETTWVYSANPYLHALTWLIGRTSNGVKTMGVHAPIASIDVAAFVTGANVADANGWSLGGVIFSTDSKWDVLVSMLQAGSGTPIKLGALISCIVNTPLVSLDTLTGADVVGKASIATTTASRDRINAVWPRYREEQQSWQIVPTQSAVIVSSYVTADGGQRTRETEYTLVQSATQASVMARYDIENAREITPIVLPCKPRWMGYKPGDCITVNEPEYGLVNQTMLILAREVDPSSLVTTLTMRTETTAKHAFALGQTNTAPPTPAIQGFNPSLFAGPLAGAWTAAGSTIVSGAQTVPVINVTGAVDNALAASVIVQYSPAGQNDWTVWAEVPASTTSVQITGLAPATSYDVEISYRSVKGVLSSPTVITPTGGAATGALSAGATTGVNLYSPSYGTLTDAQVFTALGTSANTANVGTASAAQIQVLPADVTQAVGNITTNTANIATNTLIGGALAAYMSAQTTLAGQSVGTVLQTFQAQQATANQSYAANFTLLGAKNAAGTAWQFSGGTVLSDGVTTLSTFQTYVQNVLGNGQTSIASILQTVNGLNANITLSVNSNGQVVGLDIGTSGVPNSGYFDILTSKFRLIDTSSGQTLVPLSYTSGVGWVFNSNVAINGNLLISGSVVTGAIDPGDITNTTYVESTTSTSLGNVGGAAVQIGSLTLTLSGAPVTVDVLVQINNTDTAHDNSCTLTLQRDGTQISDPFYCFTRQNSSSFSGGQPASQFAPFFDTGATAGSHTYSVYAQFTGGTTNGSAVAKLCRIIVQDLKTEA